MQLSCIFIHYALFPHCCQFANAESNAECVLQRRMCVKYNYSPGSAPYSPFWPIGRHCPDSSNKPTGSGRKGPSAVFYAIRCRNRRILGCFEKIRIFPMGCTVLGCFKKFWLFPMGCTVSSNKVALMALSDSDLS